MKLFLWTITLLLLGNLLAIGYLINLQLRKSRDKEVNLASTRPDERLKPGEVAFPLKQAESYLVEEVRKEPPWYEPVLVYGAVVPNPHATIEVRSPFAGTLRKATAWPRAGQYVEARQELAWIDVRVGPQEMLDLKSKLNEAHNKLLGAQETLHIQEARVKRFEESPSIPIREREEARIQLTEARTQEAVLRAALDLYRTSLAEAERPDRTTSTWSKLLKAPAAGEVTDWASRPGMAVEAGGLVVQLVDFNRVLVRLDLPAEVLLRGPPAEVALRTADVPPPSLRGARNQPKPGPTSRKVTARLLGPGSQIDASSQLAAFYFQFDIVQAGAIPTSVPRAISGTDDEGIAWRPGLLVKAELRCLPPPDIEPREAISVPDTAVLYHQGRALVYVQERIVKAGQKELMVFSRREVQILGRTEDRCILAASPFRPGDRVVSDEPQVFLSAEFLADVDAD